MSFRTRLRPLCQLIVGAALLVLSSCRSGDGIQVSGVVTYQGEDTAAELSFEQLNADGKPVGRAVTANANADGHFRVQLSTTDSATFRIVIRVAEPQAEGALPPGFDSLPLGIKTVQLERRLSEGARLTFALTR